ncbi:MAG: hypothetical protein ACI9SK_001257 [Zhongshania sp.]|jgi:hypothetical protein
MSPEFLRSCYEFQRVADSMTENEKDQNGWWERYILSIDLY